MSEVHFNLQLKMEITGFTTAYTRLHNSADIQGPINRPVSDDFCHFFTQIATEYSLRAGDSPYARSTRF